MIWIVLAFLAGGFFGALGVAIVSVGGRADDWRNDELRP